MIETFAAGFVFGAIVVPIVCVTVAIVYALGIVVGDWRDQRRDDSGHDRLDGGTMGVEESTLPHPEPPPCPAETDAR